MASIDTWPLLGAVSGVGVVTLARVDRGRQSPHDVLAALLRLPREDVERIRAASRSRTRRRPRHGPSADYGDDGSRAVEPADE